VKKFAARGYGAVGDASTPRFDPFWQQRRKLALYQGLRHNARQVVAKPPRTSAQAVFA
jgi:hypothetical protein